MDSSQDTHQGDQASVGTQEDVDVAEQGPSIKKRAQLDTTKEKEKDKNKEVDKLELTFMKLAEQENDDKRDADRLYCLSLVPPLQQLNPRQKSLVKIGIEQVFLDVTQPLSNTWQQPGGQCTLQLRHTTVMTVVWGS